jgi:hypothetical protein
LARRGIKTWIGRPGGHVIFSSRDRPASLSSRLRRTAQAGSERNRIAHVQRSFFSELGSGLRDGRARAPPRIRGHCSSAALVAYIEPEWTLVPGPFLCEMTNSGCFAAAGTAMAVMTPGRTESGVGGHQSVQGTVIKLPIRRPRRPKDGEPSAQKSTSRCRRRPGVSSQRGGYRGWQIEGKGR